MKILLCALAGITVGYILGAIFGYVAVRKLSANMHDGAVEAAMTGAFVSGPIGAITGAILGIAIGRRM